MLEDIDDTEKPAWQNRAAKFRGALGSMKFADRKYSALNHTGACATLERVRISHEGNAADHAESANKWVVFALSGAAAFMTNLDASIVNIGLPSIAHTFGVSLTGAI